jgi:hypothetical protein
MMTSFQQKAKHMTRSTKIKPAVSTNAIFNTCVKENLQFITGLLKSGAFNHGLTARTKNTCRRNTREMGQKVHILSNHTESKHMLTTGCSPKSRYKDPGIKFSMIASYVQAHANQIGCTNYSTRLISRFGTETKVTLSASSSEKSLVQNSAQGTKYLMLLSVLP